jgi:3-methyladenine DNA glycosylase AlkC
MKQTVKQRHEIARNPSTPADVLVRLATDKNKYVRMCVAANPSTPVDVLAQLAADENKWVRWYVANNPQTAVDSHGRRRGPTA